MKGKKRWIGLGLAGVIGLSVSLYGYVFVAGAPQLDGPSSAVANASMPLDYQIETYSSAVLKSDRTYGVVLPPGYADHPTQRYPVIFLLHGGHGDPTDWFKKAAALPVIQELYANHKLPPSLIITPDGNDDRGSNPFTDPDYFDGPHGPILSAIGDELVQVIRSRYRTKSNPAFWAMGGLSSGGWGALNIGLHRPQYFSILFSHSGYFQDVSGPQNSPMSYITQLNPLVRKRLKIYLDAGEGDGKYLIQSRQFHQVLDRLGVPNKFNEFPGGHGLYGPDVGWNYWHTHLADSLEYVGVAFQTAERQEKRAALLQHLHLLPSKTAHHPPLKPTQSALNKVILL